MITEKKFGVPGNVIYKKPCCYIKIVQMNEGIAMWSRYEFKEIRRCSLSQMSSYFFSLR